MSTSRTPRLRSSAQTPAQNFAPSQACSRGMTSQDAAVHVGVSPVVGTRWFREHGGMPPHAFPALSGRYLSFVEREEIALLRAQDAGVREIARRLGRSPSLQEGAHPHPAME